MVWKTFAKMWSENDRLVHAWDGFQDSDFQSLLEQRKLVKSPRPRAELSKKIRKQLRRKLREQRASRIQHVLEEFSALDRLHACHSLPVRYIRYLVSKSDGRPLPEDFARYLGNIFSSDTGFGSPNVKKLLEETAANGFGDVHPFTVHELKQVLKQMRKNRCADSIDVLAEYFIFGSDELHQRLVTIYNDMIQSGCLEESWRNTIAIQEITYIFFFQNWCTNV